MTTKTKRSTAELLAMDQQNYLPVTKRQPLALVRGSGSRVWDSEGKEYIDALAGIAVNSVGHGHPVLAAAIAEQAARLMHVSNLFYNDRAIELASAIVDRTAFDRVYFCNSGAEANESLLKLARRFHHEQGQGDRVELVSTHRSFHGRTLGALSVTGQDKYHVGMGPLLPGVRFVPYNDVDALRAVIGPRTAAVLLEPVQAEGGIIPAAPGYLESVRALCDEFGIMIVQDLQEVIEGFRDRGMGVGGQFAAGKVVEGTTNIAVLGVFWLQVGRSMHPPTASLGGSFAANKIRAFAVGDGH